MTSLILILSSLFFTPLQAGDQLFADLNCVIFDREDIGPKVSGRLYIDNSGARRALGADSYINLEGLESYLAHELEIIKFQTLQRTSSNEIKVIITYLAGDELITSKTFCEEIL